MGMAPPTTSEIIFSEQANHNFSKTLGEIKKHTLSIRNRLQSILEDAAFVERVSAAYGRPLIANERCGSWYIDPTNKDGSAYFKSTDGHTGVWSFSTRRLNVHLLKAIGKHDGFVTASHATAEDELRGLDVSSWTQLGGERVGMPDALSKTIPIWCSILNRALFPESLDYHELYTPPRVVSSSEHAQMSARLEGFLESFLALDIDRSALRQQLQKPMRPIWVTPDSYLSPEEIVFEEYYPIICCTSSRRVPGGEVSEGGYIQGSGDDTENWAFGLTPPVFWANKTLLLSTQEAELPELISKLTAASSLAPSKGKAYDLLPIPPTTSLYFADLNTIASTVAEKHKLIISLYQEATLPSDIQPTLYYLPIALGPHKLCSRNLRTALPTIISHVAAACAAITTPEANPLAPETVNPQLSITIACPTGKDHSVGVALALLCLFYDDNGQLRTPGSSDEQATSAMERTAIDKMFVKRRLSWIMTAVPDANPSGATLQSVNSFLMPKR